MNHGQRGTYKMADRKTRDKVGEAGKWLPAKKDHAVSVIPSFRTCPATDEYAIRKIHSAIKSHSCSGP